MTFSAGDQREIMTAIRLFLASSNASQASVDALTVLINALTVSVDDLTSPVDDLILAMAVVDGYTEKIDSAATDGLTGVDNSLGYRIEEIEKHFHNQEVWYGKNPAGGLALENGLDAWQLTAGDGDAFGTWIQITDGTQFTSGVKFDMHRAMIKAVSAQDKLYLIQIGTGESGAQAVKTSFPFYAPSNQVNAGPVDVIKGRELNTVKLWARCSCETNGATIDPLFGVHFYSG